MSAWEVISVILMALGTTALAHAVLIIPLTWKTAYRHPEVVAIARRSKRQAIGIAAIASLCLPLGIVISLVTS